MKNRIIVVLLFLVLVLSACTAPAPTDPPATEAADPQPTATAVPVEPTSKPTEEPTAIPDPTEPPAPEWTAPIELLEGVIREVPSTGQIESGELLLSVEYPEGDYEADLISHGKLDAPVEGYVETENERLVLDEIVNRYFLNATETFWISFSDIDELHEVEFKLLGISEHAYFWFDTDRSPDPAQVQEAIDGFEAIVADIQAVFGAEHPQGIDGDPRIFILHAAGTNLCKNVNETTAHQCGVLGYFWGVNQYPTEYIWFSNMHEGLIMNLDGTALGGENYLDTLAHEYRHLVEFWYRDYSETWEAEGQAVMAEDLLGFRNMNIAFADTYMSDPDIQLNTWGSGSSRDIFHYGYGFVFSKYIFDRFGPDFFAAWAKYPDGGLDGLTALMAEQGIDLTGEQLWLDLLATLVLFDKENTPDVYSFEETFAAVLDPVGYSNIPAPPRSVEDQVRQYGADIYRLIADGDLSVTFNGSTLNPLLGRVPPSGEYFWYGGRGSSGMRTLTLEVDLSAVEKATLNYALYYKLSKSFGFGYVVISTDGGETWTQLLSEKMKGEKVQDDPYDFALTDRFYTGTSPGGSWNDEVIDISEYAGQTVWIRWEADSGNRDTGMAIDNIAIPEIGFYDDVETENGSWASEGWIRTTAYIPQTYHLMLITFENGVPVVTDIELDEMNSASFDVTGLNESDAYLIVAASASKSQQPTSYMIDTTGK